MIRLQRKLWAWLAMVAMVICIWPSAAYATLAPDGLFGVSQKVNSGASVSLSNTVPSEYSGWFAPAGISNVNSFVYGSTITATPSLAQTIYAPVTAGSYKFYLVSNSGTIQEGSNVLSVAPRILSKMPIAGAAMVMLDSNVKIVFADAMDASSINAANITITTAPQGQPEGQVAGGYLVSYDANSKTALVTFPSGLQEHTTYKVRVGTGVESANGINMMAEESWTFSTISTTQLFSSPFDLAVVHNGTVTNGNKPMGVYYYFTGDTITFRMLPRTGATLPNNIPLPAPETGYTLSVDLQALGGSAKQILTYKNPYWETSYAIPSSFVSQGPQILPVSMNIVSQEPFPVGIMVATININPKNMGFGLAGETTDWKTISDFNNITQLCFDRFDNGTHMAKVVLGNANNPINLCKIDSSGNAVTARASQKLQENLDMAMGKMSINTAVDALAEFNKPAAITFYNIDSSISPGVKYIPNTGDPQILISKGTANFSNGTGKISSYNWDAAARTLTLGVTEWSGYELIRPITVTLMNNADNDTTANIINPSNIFVKSNYAPGHVYLVPRKASPYQISELDPVINAGKGLMTFVSQANTAVEITNNKAAKLGLAAGTYDIYATSPIPLGLISDPAKFSVIISENVNAQNVSVNSDGSNKVLAITSSTVNLGSPVTITVPSAVTDASLNVASLLSAPAGGMVTTSALPAITVSATTSLSSSPIKIDIPAGATVCASAASNWDGTINVPAVQPNNSVNVVADAGNTATVAAVIEVGFGDVPLTFSKAVRILIPGQYGKYAGYYRDNTFTKISRVCLEDSQSWADSNIPDGGEAVMSVGSDMVIWTKHFTKFAAYTQSIQNSGGSSYGSSGSSGSGASANTIKANVGGTISDKGVSIIIPEDAMSSDAVITINKASHTDKLPMAPKKKIIGDVMEIYKNTNGDFSKAVTININFDKNLFEAAKYNLSLYWLDEKANQWIELNNVKVDLTAAKVSGEVNHFTKFALIATEKTNVESIDTQSPGAVDKITDISGHWAEDSIRSLVKSGAVSGYPYGSFRPDQSISRAEFATVLTKAFKLQSENGKVFKDTAGHWAKDYISAAYSSGIVKGYSDMYFGPDDPITREQMTVMIAAAAKLGKSSSEAKYTDAAKISSWAMEAVAAASANGIIKGYTDNSFKPQAKASRAEAVTVIIKALKHNH